MKIPLPVRIGAQKAIDEGINSYTRFLFHGTNGNNLILFCLTTMDGKLEEVISRSGPMD